MAETAQQHDECAQASALDPNHALLKPFEGRFRATVRMWMGPGEPHVMTGVMINTLELGGRFLKQHYTGDPGDPQFPAFEGRGYWGYNTATKQFEGFWIDTVSTVMQTEAGSVDASGKVWTMTGRFPSPSGDGELVKRTVIALKDNNRHSMTMYMTVPGQEEAKCMEIEYVRG